MATKSVKEPVSKNGLLPVGTRLRSGRRLATIAFMVALLIPALQPVCLRADDSAAPLPNVLIGYTEFRTNLPGGRLANVETMRACVIRADGTQRKILAGALINRPHSWTQFAGWSPDGKQAIIGLGWEDPENAQWEEEHQGFRYTREGWLYDIYLVDITAGKAINLTDVERVSFHNTGLFYWPGDPNTLGFQALIDGQSHPFRMDRDGKHKVDLSAGASGFTYGFSASPDGKRISYHKDYQIFIADADGSNVTHIKTGQPFNFCPTWPADGAWLLFLSGEHYNCHPHVVKRDGTGLHKLGDRNGYRGVMTFLDVPDFHGGSSDVPVWSAEGDAVFYTAKVGKNVELFRATLDGRTEQLTASPQGTHVFHPTPGPDKDWIIFGSTQSGARRLYTFHLPSKRSAALTNVEPGTGTMWPHWQPVSP